jgi:hypothetical protein
MEMLSLVRAKKAEFMDELQADDPRELMNTEMSKWERVSLSMNARAGISYYRSPEACKYKWQTLLPKYKRVADVHRETRTNSMAYFDMSFGQRRSKELPKNFDVYIYEEMNSWLRYKPTMALPHFQDLLHPNDCNYRPMSVSVEDLTNGDESMGDAVVHAYSNATAFDAAAVAASDCNPIPKEVDALVGGNPNVHMFPSPPPPTTFAVYLRQWPDTSPILPYP